MICRRAFGASLLAASYVPLSHSAFGEPRGKTIYVSNDGRDTAAGLSPGSPTASLSKAAAAADPGDTIALRCGDSWHEMLHVGKSGIVVRSYGSGPTPRILGDATRHCIWVSAPNAVIDGIDGGDGLHGVIIQGRGASATIRNCSFEDCGTGIAVGGGGKSNWGGLGLGPPRYGQLLLAERVRCIKSRTARGAGDGIQIGEDSTAGVTHVIRNATCQWNEWGGINAKSGTVVVENCNLSFNGLLGWNAHINCEELQISRCTIEGNSTAERGTAQAMIEDHVRVRSTRNIYRNPHNGPRSKGQYTMQIHVVPGAHPEYEKRPELTCITDVFVNRVGQTMTLGSIGAYMTDIPARITVLQCTFDHGDNSGIAIDGYRSSKLSITAKNNIFSLANTRALRLDPRAMFTGQIDHNLYFGTATVVEIERRGSYRANALSRLFGEFGIERHGIAADPLFVDPANGDYRLRPDSPALRAGVSGLGVIEDAAGRAYGASPSLGAYSE